jgi:hypothetical protein
MTDKKWIPSSRPQNSLDTLTDKTAELKRQSIQRIVGGGGQFYGYHPRAHKIFGSPKPFAF